jgi:putative AlgH/UPF0301 family transcriptional regulator
MIKKITSGKLEKEIERRDWIITKSRAKDMNDVLWKMDYQPEIKMGMDYVSYYSPDQCNGELKGHAWIAVNGKDYYKMER